jgi:hypothetical protein
MIFTLTIFGVRLAGRRGGERYAREGCGGREVEKKFKKKKNVRPLRNLNKKSLGFHTIYGYDGKPFGL